MRLQICLETCLSSRFMAIMLWPGMTHLVPSQNTCCGWGAWCKSNGCSVVLVKSWNWLVPWHIFLLHGDWICNCRFSTLMWVLGAVMGSGNTPTSNHKDGGVPCRDSTTWTWLKETPGVWIQVGTRYVPGCWDGGLPLPLQQECCNEMTPRWSGHSRNTGGTGCPTQSVQKLGGPDASE